jgi:hypothetical protein
MRFACWITKATDTHSEYVIFIAFPQQQWLRERALMLRCTHNAYLVYLHRCDLNRLAQAVMLPICVQKVAGSNLCQYTELCPTVGNNIGDAQTSEVEATVAILKIPSLNKIIPVSCKIQNNIAAA